MSEYWVSHKKYFCKYCDIYIADDAPSRRQHENGLRHKGNRDRYVRGLYKQGERKKKDLEEEKREMARVEQAANAAYARDISSGNASVASSSRLPEPGKVESQEKKPSRPTSTWTNYSTAQSLGYTDPDEELRLAELERRKTQGVVGVWEVVAPPPPPLPGQQPDVKEEDIKEGIIEESQTRKREAIEVVDDDADGRQFKLRRRTIGAGLGEIWDPGDIPIKLKPKEKEESPTASIGDSRLNLDAITTGSRECGQSPASGGVASEVPDPAREQLKWKPMGWKRATAPEANGHSDTNSEAVVPGNEGRPVKAEVQLMSSRDEAPLKDPPVAKSEATVPDIAEMKEEEKSDVTASQGLQEHSGSMFRKRKLPAGVRGKR